MEKCYEYFNCEKKECVMFSMTDNVSCWDVSGTLCSHPGVELYTKLGKEKCKICIYYNTVNK